MHAPARAPGRSGRARLLVLLVALGTLLAGVRSARAHPHNTAPPVDLVITIRGTEVLALIDMQKMQLLSWGEPPRPYRDLEAAVAGATALAKVVERLEVAIDGEPVMPVLRSFGDPPFDEKEAAPRVKLAVVYPTTKKPTNLRVTWKDFFGIVWEGIAQVPLLIEADSHVDTAMLAKHEPEYIWHWKPPSAFRTATAPVAEPAAGSRLPLVPLALLAVGLLLPFVGPLKRRGGGARWAPAGLALAAGAGVFCAGLGAVDAPWGRAEPPTEAQARSVFTSLLHNVYRAMDAKTEKEIYALLAASVERTILDGLYGDVYESLVLRDQGGVIARVEDVSLHDVAIAYPANGSATQFTATASWQLKASVSHLGHTHQRQNLYRAEVVVRHDGAAWRIASVTMLERKRLDDGRGGLLDTPKDIPVPPAAPAGSKAEPAGPAPAPAPGSNAEKPR